MRQFVGAVLSISLLFLDVAHARGPGWSLSMPTFSDEGDTAFPFTLSVGETAISPFYPDPKKDRAWFIQNPHPTCDLFVGTTSTFTYTEAHWFVSSSSGSFASSSHQRIWLLYPPGCGSQLVTGGVLRQ